MLEESCSMAKQIIHAGFNTPSRMKNEDFKTAEQKLHTELLIKNEIEVENVPMEFQVTHVINNPLIIKDDDMKIDQDHLIIKDENVDEQSFIYNQSNLQNHTGLEIKRDLKERFQMDLASDNSCIKRESSLHTELILKDEDIEENHNNSNINEQSVIDQSNLKNHTVLEIKSYLENSVPMDLASGNSCIKRESSLHTELILKDEDIEDNHNNLNVGEQSFIDQSNFQNHGLEIKKDLEKSAPMDLASGKTCIKRESSLHTELILKDEDIEDNHNNSNVDEQSVIDRSNLQNHGLEIKKDLEKSIPMDLASGNSCIKRESSLHTELILKDEDIEDNHNNLNVDEQSVIDQSNLQNHGLEEIEKDLEERVPKGPTNDDLRINNESSLRKELKMKDKDVEKTYENSDLDNLQTVTIQSNLNSPKRDQKGCFSCHLCNKKLTTRYGLSNHYRIHKGEKPIYAGDCQERPFLCDKCGKKFLRKSQLEKHDDSVHSDEKRFSCNICDKKYTGKYTLSMHIKLFHTGENHKYYSCDICNRKFNYKSALNCHKRTHTGEKPFSCNICNKKFARSDTLIDHKLTHTGEKTFLCDVCDKKFSRRDTLIAHKQIHTPESLIKTFSCDFCEKKFRLKGTLITHKRLHTGEKPFSCDVCDRKFTTLYSLNSHKLVHTGKKSFFCDVCDKKFSKKHHVTQHKRSHTGEKPYACDVCDKRYFKNQDLVKHKKKHAND